MASGQEQGGYECELVEPPPEAFQTKCPICLLVLRTPHQVSCCGYNFCKTCISQHQLEARPGPVCRAAKFDAFHDKRLQRSLNKLHIRCTHETVGCKWTGELGMLDKHLNKNPREDEQLLGCEFTEIKCLYCTKLFQRRNVQAHQLECPRRRKYYNDTKLNYQNVATKHWTAVPCPKNCTCNAME